ncbi:hypothetical protein ACFQ1S_07630 [Kibdelosporangium lantanae]|uniref:MFS transporter n=1 Tax=Kibdelosporangium lantanae TaxID=1497396 RepID=A0ABW3M458_9PSEU
MTTAPLSTRVLWFVCLCSALYVGWWMYDTYVTHPFVFMDLDAYSLGVACAGGSL